MNDLLRTALRVLFFRASTEELASLDRRHLALGLVASALAGIGRFWDNPGVSVLAHGGGWSVLHVFIVAAVFVAVARLVRVKTVTTTGILTLVTLSAPPAALFAIPVERFLDPVSARFANLGFLLIVSTWRVALVAWYFTRVGELRAFEATVVALFPVTGVFAALSGRMGVDPLLGIMGTFSGIAPDGFPEAITSGLVSFSKVALLTLFPLGILIGSLVVARRGGNPNLAGRTVLAFGIRLSLLALFLIPPSLGYAFIRGVAIAPAVLPSDLGYRYETITLREGDLTTVGWFLPAQPNGEGRRARPDVGVVGVHGHLGSKIDAVNLFGFLSQSGMEVVVPSLRGHPGGPNLPVTFGDAETAEIEAAVRFLEGRGKKRIVGAGLSMGAAATVLYEARNPGRFAAVLLDSPFADLSEMARYRLDGLPFPGVMTLMIRPWGQYFAGRDLWTLSPEREIVHGTAPMLIFHGTADNNVPIAQAKKLVAAAGGRATLVPVRGANHIGSRFVDVPAYDERARSFLAAQGLFER